MGEPKRRIYLYPIVTNRQVKFSLILTRLTLHFLGKFNRCLDLHCSVLPTVASAALSLVIGWPNQLLSSSLELRA